MYVRIYIIFYIHNMELKITHTYMYVRMYIVLRIAFAFKGEGGWLSKKSMTVVFHSLASSNSVRPIMPPLLSMVHWLGLFWFLHSTLIYTYYTLLTLLSMLSFTNKYYWLQNLKDSGILQRKETFIWWIMHWNNC